MRSCSACGEVYGDEATFCPEDGTSLVAVEDDLLGTMVGQYKLIQRLGAGSMGSVWIGEHPTIRSRVAVKFLHRKLVSDPTAVGRFTNEARAANLIGHDNIVKVHDLGSTADGLPYIAMELLEGESLEAFLKRRGPVPLNEAGPIAVQICSGVHAAHENGIVHRDLKPANIFLAQREGRDDFVKLLDFGVAKLAPSLGSAVRTRAGAMLGSPWYMAPELAMGEAADRRSDIYSVGIVLYEMATGRVPFPEKDLSGALVAHVQRAPDPPRSLVKTIPADYEAVILHALEKDRGQRYQTMNDLRDEIARCLQKAPPVTNKPARPVKPPVSVPAAGPQVQSVTMLRKKGKGQQQEALPTVFLGQPVSRKTPLALGIALGAVLALVGLIFLLRAKPKVAAPLLEPMDPVELAARKQQLLPPQLPVLSVVSTPLGASVKAKWQGGEVTKLTPFTLELKKGTEVHLEYSLAGYDPAVLDITIDKAGFAAAELHVKAPAPVAQKTRRVRPPRAGSGSKSLKSDDPEVVEFGDDLFHDEK